MTASLTDEAEALLTVLRQSADGETVAAIERFVAEASDRALCRINPLVFAARHHLDEERVIGAFLHAARLGIFELSWNVLCPGCGGVLESGTTLKSIHSEAYACALCAVGYEPSLDEMVEVTFTISRRVRRIAGHDPDELPFFEYFRQIFWASAMDLPDDLEAIAEELTLDTLELPSGQKAQLSLHLPAEFLIVTEPVTHAAQFIDVKGEQTRERQNLAMVFNDVMAPTGNVELRPGPLRLSLENRTRRRLLPGVWIAGDALHELMARRRPFLTAKRLLTNQIFRDIYRTDTLDVDQRLKITSLTFLFTDLKGSTALYNRVGDLVAFDLVRAHFRVLNEIVASEAGAVVKTIGDAVMATFVDPVDAVRASAKIHRTFYPARADTPIRLRISLNTGPCIAVRLNSNADFFGGTVNVAAKLQALAEGYQIAMSEATYKGPGVAEYLSGEGAELEEMTYTSKALPAAVGVRRWTVFRE
jgi:class 3 adenylate cyclase